MIDMLKQRKITKIIKRQIAKENQTLLKKNSRIAKSEIKNLCDSQVSYQITIAEDKISELEDKSIKKSRLKHREKRTEKQNIRKTWKIVRWSKICITEVPESEQKEDEENAVFEKIMTEKE